MCIPVTEELRNPLHRRALRLSDIRPGLSFIKIYADSGKIHRGVITGRRNTGNSNATLWHVQVELEVGVGQTVSTHIFLEESGVIPCDLIDDEFRWYPCYMVADSDIDSIPLEHLHPK